MSVGGFAGGMASAFQKALDREQQEKLEDKRNTQANLRQAAGFAHDLKLYSRKVRDEERKSLKETEQSLKAIFGTGAESMPYVQAWMHMGSAGVKQLEELRAFAKEKRVPFKSYMKINYPVNPDTNELYTKDTYGAVDLSDTIKGLIHKRTMLDHEGTKVESPYTYSQPQLTVDVTDISDQTAVSNLSFDETIKELFLLKQDLAKATDPAVKANINKEIEEISKWKDAILEGNIEEATSKKTASSTGDSASLMRLVKSNVNSAIGGAMSPFDPEGKMVTSLENRIDIKMSGNASGYLMGLESGVNTLRRDYKIWKKKAKPNNPDAVTAFDQFNSTVNNMAINPHNTAIQKLIREGKENNETPIIYNAYAELNASANPEVKTQNNTLEQLKVGQAIHIFKPILDGTTVVSDPEEYKNIVPQTVVFKGHTKKVNVTEATKKAEEWNQRNPTKAQKNWTHFYNPYGIKWFQPLKPFSRTSAGK